MGERRLLLAPLLGFFLFDAYGFNVPVTLNIVLVLVDIVFNCTLLRTGG
jgi:hypothetical protein